MSIKCSYMDNYYLYFLIFSTVICLVQPELIELSSDFTTDEKLKYDDIPFKYTWLTTPDGYIIKIYHLIGDDGNLPPVLFVHGFYSSSNCWILESKHSNKTLAYQLQQKGHDVFLLNLRGNIFSRNHTHLNPEEGSKSTEGGGMTGFWNFSYHEMGIYDLPLTINYILKQTNQSKIYYFGHNIGSTVYFVLLSEYPEFNSKILLAVQLSPVVFFTNNRNRATILGQNIVPGFTQSLLESTGPGELLPKGSSKFLVESCLKSKALVEIMCAASIYQISGYNPKQLNSTAAPIYISHLTEGSSLRTQLHVWQAARSKKFTYYDWGPFKNTQLTGSETPREYKLSNCKAPIIIYHGKGDLLVDIKDINNLYRILEENYQGDNARNLIPVIISDPAWTNTDFLYAKDVNRLFNEPVMNIMQVFERKEKGLLKSKPTSNKADWKMFQKPDSD